MSWPTMTDYQEAIQNPNFCFKDHELQSGLPVIGLWNVPKAMSGSFAVVFQIDCNGRKYAVKCFTTYHPDLEQRYSIISQYLQQTRLPYMVSFEFLRQGIKVRGQWYPILKMEWVDGDPLNSYIEKNLGNSQSILSLAEKFSKLIYDLSINSIAHCDLQHGNILIVNSDFRLIDYDGMYVPGLDGMLSHELGHRNYQHPNRTEQDFGPYLDNFSALVIYISLIALSKEPNFWYRFNAGDEHLLFRREDFENPESSEIINTLEKMRDSKIQELISKLRMLIKHPVSLIGEPIPPVNKPSERPPLNPPEWIIGYISEPPVNINQTYVLERLFITAFAMIGTFFIYTATSGLLAPIIVMSVIGGELALLILLLTIRFRSFPEVIQKLKLSSNLTNLRRDIKQIENNINRLNNSMNRLVFEEDKKINEINSKQREYAQREKNEIDAISRELLNILSDINSQRKALNQAETSEITQALCNFQRQFLTSQLTRYDLVSANIQGIGPEMKKRLLEAGIKSAADIINIHIAQSGWGRYSREVAYIETSGQHRIHVEGIGPKKAKSLLFWKQNIEAGFRSHMPQSLPSTQENAIRLKYQVQRGSIERQEADAKGNANQRKEAVIRKYHQKRNALTNQLRDLRDQFGKQRRDLDQKISQQKKLLNDKQWTLAMEQRKFEAYRQVNFAVYLKRVLFL